MRRRPAPAGPALPGGLLRRPGLYIDDPRHTGTTCGVSGVAEALCGVNDARDYVPQGSPDPKADPSRARVEGVFDFTTGDVVFRRRATPPTSAGSWTASAGSSRSSPI
ncbi:MAG TPA: hypothetical protein VF520_06025 [Thermoleophilaceae bacterium]